MLNAKIEADLKRLKKNSNLQRSLSAEIKNRVLLQIAEQLVAQTNSILEANQIDLNNTDSSITSAFRDRLTLNPQRIEAMAESLRQVARLSDPVDEVIEAKQLPNGLFLKKVRAPIGIIFMIFESRPNVITEAFSLAFKAGNTIILRGGSDSKNTAQVLYSIIRIALKEEGLEAASFYALQDYDREIVLNLLKRKDLIDLVVPRGGEKLIQMVQNESLMPIIKNDRGLCHCYVDTEADIEMALNIVENAKSQRPGVCNSLETVLVHEKVAKGFLPQLYNRLQPHKTQWFVDSKVALYVKGEDVKMAAYENWNTEYLDHIINAKVVVDLNEALAHIAEFSSLHSEIIVTKNSETAKKFQNAVDAAVVYWNASSRFTDGFEFGLGGELGISTQKLHVRGPVGLKELTTPRWLVEGQGQVRS